MLIRVLLRKSEDTCPLQAAAKIDILMARLGQKASRSSGLEITTAKAGPKMRFPACLPAQSASCC